MNMSNTTLCEPFHYINSFIVYGILYPIVAVMTTLTNVLVISVFIKRKMRSPTTVLLIGLAASDAVSCVIIVPLFVYLYGFGYHTMNLDYPMCMYHDYSYIVSNIFHTASSWLTTILAVQRYIVVAHPFRGPRFCTIRKSYVAIFVVFLLAPMMYIPSFLYRNYNKIVVYDEEGFPHQTCSCPLTGVDVYESALVFLKSSFAKFIPCLILSITTFLLVRKLEIETERILRLHADDEMEEERRDFRLIRRTSIMVALIVISFLLVEIPSTVKVIVTKIDENAIEKENDYTVSMYLNFCLLVSYHVNFWIYVFLSEQFRKCLKIMVCCHNNETFSNNRNGYESRRELSDVRYFRRGIHNEFSSIMSSQRFPRDHSQNLTVKDPSISVETMHLSGDDTTSNGIK